MSMTRLVYGLAALPLIMGVAFAAPVKQQDSKASAKQPMQLTEQQMDKVTAGWDIIETDCSNTHCTWLSIYENRTAVVPLTGVADFGIGNNINCVNSQTACYLLYNSPSISIASAFYKQF